MEAKPIPRHKVFIAIENALKESANRLGRSFIVDQALCYSLPKANEILFSLIRELEKYHSELPSALVNDTSRVAVSEALAEIDELNKKESEGV